MIEVRVNGQPREVADGTSVRELLVLIGVDPTRKGIAAAVGGEVVPRSQWASTPVTDGAAIEVVTASQGG